MKKWIGLVLVMVLCLGGCGEKDATQSVDENLVASVNGVSIFRQDIQSIKGNADITDKEAVEKLIDNKLLMGKLKRENVTMTDDEVKAGYRNMLQMLDPDSYQKGDEDAITTEQLQGLREVFLLTKYKMELGNTLQSVLGELRNSAEIHYFNGF